MTARCCARLWEAEALADGRLTGPDRASFERHAAMCSECRTELEEVGKLDRAMLAVDVGELGELERQRARSRLLERANAEILDVPRHGRARARVLAAFTLAAIAVLTGVLLFRIFRTDLRPSASSTALEPPKVDVVPAAGTIVADHSAGSLRSLVMNDGSATFAVHHLEKGQRFLLALPDGEIEVRGTRFTVVVTSGRTQSVAVDEGKVVLRRPGEAETGLVAGDRWSKAESTITSAPVASNPVVATPTPPPGPSVEAKPRAPRRPLAPPASLAGERFDRGAESFDRKAYADADRELASFVRDFPDDPRCEDADYLRTVARWRLGDREGAVALAKGYLAKYPNGLRRSEASRMASTGSDSP